MTKSKYKMTIDLNILTHLGIGLYSNIIAVLSEAVANSHDADASAVSIKIENDKVIIVDNGTGMSLNDINDKFLKIGYQKRKGLTGDSILTKKYKRHPMGRKGIGKLSLLSIADNVEIHTLRDDGEKQAFSINVEDIKKLIDNGDASADYSPDEIKPEITTIGTKILLTKIRKNRTLSDSDKIRKDLSRRFAFIPNFKITVNEKELSVMDRDYVSSVIKLFNYGETGSNIYEQCSMFENLTLNKIKRDNIIKIDGKNFAINGWIGFVSSTDELSRNKEENFNKISIMSRGKLGQEDILGSLHNTSMFTNYIVGELNADFLDEDEDLATSGREGYNSDAKEYKALFDFVKAEISYIGKVWNEDKAKEGVNKAKQALPAINVWYESLKGDEKKMAQQMLGNINKSIRDESSRKEITKYGILAFEKLRYTKNLSAIESVSIETISEIGKILGGIQDVEASMYYQIVKMRLDIIEKFEEIAHKDNAVKEKVIQQYLFEHLWLLDPAWERSTRKEIMEKSFKTIFNKEVKLTKEEQDARLDICYQNFAGRLVILELKKYDRKMNHGELINQVQKYSKAAKKCLSHQGDTATPEIIVVVGALADSLDLVDVSETMKTFNARVVFYDSLIHDAQEAYRAYFDKKKELNPLIELFKKLESEINI